MNFLFFWAFCLIRVNSLQLNDSEQTWDLLDSFNVGEYNNWMYEQFNDGSIANNPNSNSNSNIVEYKKRLKHRLQIRENENSDDSIWERSPAVDDSTSIEKKSTIVIMESVPIKDSINYGSIYEYTFMPSTDSEWTHSYEILVYISASLCKLPNGWNNDTSYNGLTMYFTFNQTIANNHQFSKMSKIPFQNGYAEGLAQENLYDEDSTNGNGTLQYDNSPLRLFVTTDECETCTSNGDAWVFELGVSQKNILFLYDTDSIISVVDVDYESALFSAPKVHFNNDSTYGVYIFDTESNPLHVSLNQSWCAISNTEGFVQWVELQQNNTHGSYNLFTASDLNIDTTYYAVLVVSYTYMSFGGGIFQMFNFTTAEDKACKIVYNLDFCDEVAYAVPVSSDFANGTQTLTEMMSMYDNYSSSLFVPFEFALQQTACDTELDARYSPVRTCDHCRYSYRQWLCAVTIPRCAHKNSAVSSQYKDYNAGSGRNEFIKNEIVPALDYLEIQPCLNVCQSIVRDCPSVFGFGCPDSAKLALLSYGDPKFDDDNNNNNDDDDDDDENSNTENNVLVCNFIGTKNIF